MPCHFTSSQNLRGESVEPSRPFVAQAPIKASPNLAARLGAAGIDDLIIETQLSRGGGEIVSHMARLADAHDQQFYCQN
jgi:hypothetical protein